ncbi:MAG: TolC family protein [Bacteroidales bacterium]|jgi:outer membrane protein TolC
MSKKRVIFLLVCIAVIMGTTCEAQQKRKFNPLTDDITQMIPPMSTLLDSAFAHDPGLKFSQLQYIIDKGSLYSGQVQWTQDIGLQANGGYGTFDYLYNNAIGGQNQQTTTLKQNETQYGVGGFIRLPLYDLVNRKNQIKTARAVMQQAETLSETRKNEIRELVIRQYNDIIEKQQILKIKSRYLETSRINTQMAEKGFVKGTITLDEYSRVSQIGSSTEADYETARTDFINSYMIMEVMTGMNFNIINEIPQGNENQ